MSYSILIIVIKEIFISKTKRKLNTFFFILMNNEKSSLELSNIPIFHYSNQSTIFEKLEIKKRKSK